MSVSRRAKKAQATGAKATGTKRSCNARTKIEHSSPDDNEWESIHRKVDEQALIINGLIVELKELRRLVNANEQERVRAADEAGRSQVMMSGTLTDRIDKMEAQVNKNKVSL